MNFYLFFYKVVINYIVIFLYKVVINFYEVIATIQELDIFSIIEIFCERFEIFFFFFFKIIYLFNNLLNQH